MCFLLVYHNRYNSHVTNVVPKPGSCRLYLAQVFVSPVSEEHERIALSIE
jgi:hypothetical protein